MNYKDNSNVYVILSSLKKRILSGELKTGDRLIETSISKEFNTSRLHVKSALRQLMAEHLAEYTEMKGFRVVGATPETLEEVAQIRQALEAVVVKKVIQVATEENLAHLSRLIARLKVFVENEMFEDCFDELNKIYQYLYSICGYTRVASILMQYSDYINIIIRESAPSAKEHLSGYKAISGLIEAIINKDLDGAMHCLEARY